MEGFKYNSMDPQRGIIPRSIEEIFKYIENCSNESVKFSLKCLSLLRKLFLIIICIFVLSKHNSLSVLVTCRSTMKWSVTLFVLTGITCILGRTRNEECSLMGYRNGQSGIQVRFLVSFREVRNSEEQLQQRWTMCHQDRMQCSLSSLSRWLWYSKMIANLNSRSKSKLGS